MWSQLLLSKCTRPLLTHQSQEAVIIPSLYRMLFLPKKLQSSLLTLELCSCQERNVALLTSKGVSEYMGFGWPTAGPPPLTPHSDCLYFIRDHTQCSGLSVEKKRSRRRTKLHPSLTLPEMAQKQEWVDIMLGLGKLCTKI